MLGAMGKLFSLYLILCAVLQQGSDGLQWYSWHGQTHHDFEQKIRKYSNEDCIPVWLSGYAIGNKVQYAGIFRENPDNKIWKAYFNMTTSGLQSRNNKFKRLGYMPIQISGYSVNNSPRFAVIWVKEKRAPRWFIQWGMNSAALQVKMNEKTGSGYRVVSLSGYQQNGGTRYTAIYAKQAGLTWTTRYGMTRTRLNSFLNSKIADGYLPKSIQGYEVSGTTYYTSILERPGSIYPMMEEIDVTHDEFMDGYSDKSTRGYNLESINGYARDGVIKYALVWAKRVPSVINVTQLNSVRHDGHHSRLLSSTDQSRINRLIQAFLGRWNIPGASVAIGKNEKLVYANGFGYANVEKKEQVTPNHLFRIASISKCITSTGILRLFDQNRIDFESYVLGQNRLINVNLDNKLSTNEKSVKVKHLLKHTSTGWPNDNDDPLFNMEHLDNNGLLKWTLDNQDVPASPGTRYSYSNFGYFLLGRIIENLTDQTYSNFIKENVLSPMDISNAHIGGSTISQRRSDEATYYRLVCRV